jgi:hypothetical protein
MGQEPTSRKRRDAVLYVSSIVIFLVLLGHSVFRLTRPILPLSDDPYDGRWFGRTSDWTSVVCLTLTILIAELTRRRMKKNKSLG